MNKIGEVVVMGTMVALGYLGVRRLFRELSLTGAAVIRPRDQDGYPIRERVTPNNASRGVDQPR